MDEISNQIYRARIPTPPAWTASRVDKDALTWKLSPEQTEVMWDLVAQARGPLPDQLSRTAFDHPITVQLMREVRQELLHGMGAVVLSGLSLANRSLDDFERLLWGLGTRLGSAAMQNANGERICRVQHETDIVAPGIGYRRNIKLNPHSDFHEVLTLAAFERPALGGETGLVSSLAIHNALFEERPEHLEALYAGYFHVAPDTNEVLADRSPVFCNVDGAVSLSFHFGHHESAAKRRGESLPRELIAARDHVLQVASRPELLLTFPLERGEILFWHNFTILHSREPFTNSAERKRLLLRLWLHLPDGRPMHPSFNERARRLDRSFARPSPSSLQS